mgnify:CR=1 FL=1
MKRKHFFYAAILFATVFVLSSTVHGQRLKRSGIGVRGTVWDMDDGRITVIRDWPGNSRVDVGTGGGWIYFFSRTGESSVMEFAIGAVGRVTNEEFTSRGEETDVSAVIPVVLGMRYDIFNTRYAGALQPYLSFGGGPYWLADIHVVENRFDGEEVTVNSKLHPGGYGGGGVNFMLFDSFGFNFDVKYHFVDLKKNHEYSGFEYGLGMVVQWGDFKKSRRRRR